MTGIGSTTNYLEKQHSPANTEGFGSGSDKVDVSHLKNGSINSSPPEDTPCESAAGNVISIAASRVLDCTTSRTSRVSSISPPPDGGLAAWTVVACTHLIIMNTWGFINSYGVFQTYYTSLLDRSPSDISWIGSIQVFLLFFIGTGTGRLTDAGYFRAVYLVGSCFSTLGIFATSVCTTYWQLFLAQGVCIGIGNGCLFCPSVSLVSTYFSKKRSLAIGIMACGSGTGGLIFPAMVRQLLPSVGFGWTIRTIGFIQLFGMVMANTLLRPRVPPRRDGRIVEWAAFKELEYTFYALGAFLCFWGVYFAFYYLASFSRSSPTSLSPGPALIGTPFSYTQSLNLLLILNGIGIIGRLLPNHLADRIGPLNIFIPVAFSSGLIALCWIAVSSATGLYVWSCFYGLLAAAIQSLFPAALSSLTTDLRKQGVRMGMVFTIVSFSVLTGPPIAGAIISEQGGKYFGAQIFAGASLLLGTAFMVASKVARGKTSGGGWWDKV